MAGSQKLQVSEDMRSIMRVPFAGGGHFPELERMTSGSHMEKKMSKVPSLLFDMEMEDGHAVRTESHEDGETERALQQLDRLLAPASQTEAQLRRVVARARDTADRQRRVLEAPEVAEKLAQLGCGIKIRTALGGGWGGECLRNLRHTFLNCSLQGPGGVVTQYIVDTRFKEQFEIAHATPRYQRVLAALPRDFVGSEEHMVWLVEFLCEEMSAAFKAAGTALPPWRQAASMMSKWRPRRSEDCDVHSRRLEDVSMLRPLPAPAASPYGRSAPSPAAALAGTPAGALLAKLGALQEQPSQLGASTTILEEGPLAPQGGSAHSSLAAGGAPGGHDTLASSPMSAGSASGDSSSFPLAADLAQEVAESMGDAADDAGEEDLSVHMPALHFADSAAHESTPAPRAKRVPQYAPPEKAAAAFEKLNVPIHSRHGQQPTAKTISRFQ